MSKNLISSIEHFSPIGKSDHETVMFTLYTGVDDTNDQEVEFVYELNKGRYELMRNSVAELDWNRALSNSSVDQCWDMIKSQKEEKLKKVSNIDEWGVTEKGETKVCSVQYIFENKKCTRLQQVYRTT